MPAGAPFGFAEGSRRPPCSAPRGVGGKVLAWGEKKTKHAEAVAAV